MRTLVGWLLAAASLAWLGWLLRDAWVDISPRMELVKVHLVLLGLAMGTLSTLMGFFVFKRTFLALEGRALSGGLLAHYFFSAQLMKHLPGRFFGIGYQIAATRGWVNASRWLAANGVHVLLMMYLSVVVSLAALAVRLSWVLAGGFVVVGAAAILLLWRVTRLHAVIRGLERSRWRVLTRVAAILSDSLAIGKSPAATRIVGVAILSWVVYFGAWIIYGTAYPEYDAGTWIRVCAYYNIAWLVGYLSFITPSGLGVRELVFAFLAADLEPGALAYAMLIGRFTLLLIDLLLGLALLGFHSKNDKSRSA